MIFPLEKLSSNWISGATWFSSFSLMLSRNVWKEREREEKEEEEEKWILRGMFLIVWKPQLVDSSNESRRAVESWQGNVNSFVLSRFLSPVPNIKKEAKGKISMTMTSTRFLISFTLLRWQKIKLKKTKKGRKELSFIWPDAQFRVNSLDSDRLRKVFSDAMSWERMALTLLFKDDYRWKMRKIDSR